MSTRDSKITLQDVFQAQKNIEKSITKTPLKHSTALSTEENQVYLKLESQQITGSFKFRGASNAIAKLVAEHGDNVNGVIGVSTGNHGKGLAFAAQKAGIPSCICMSELVPGNKVEGIKSFGADVKIIGRSQDDAQVEADRLVVEENKVMLPPFDHQDVIAGQGTIALEVMSQLPNVDNIIVPVSGGGLISGIAMAMKTMNPKIKVYGVTMERGCAMYQSQKAGKPIMVEELETLADSLGGGIGIDNQYTFAMVKEYVDELILVNESQIADAIEHAYWHEQEVIEGSGAVGISLLLAKTLPLKGNTVVVVSGRNIDMTLHHKIISGERDMLN